MDILKIWNVFVISKSRAIAFLLLIVSVQLQSQIAPPRIKYIALNSGVVTIAWKKSASAGVLFYNILYLKNGDPRPTWEYVIRSLPPTDSIVSFPYSIVSSFDLETTPVSFAVEANDISDVDGLDWDSTLVINNYEFDTCSGVLNLAWTSYDFNMWENGLKAYRIYISENGGPYTIFKTVYRQSTTITDLIPENNYSVYVAAIPNEPLATSDSSTSNTISINTHMSSPPGYINADYATNVGGLTNVHFSIDPSGEIDKFNILRSKSPEGNFDSIARIVVTNNTVTFTDNVDYLTGPYYYRLEAINNCSLSATTSNNASTIVLQNTGQPLAPELLWNDYSEWENGVDNYRIERKFGNGAYELISSVGSVNYTDNEIASLAEQNYDASVCYRITATEQNNPSGVNAESVSNEVCFELPVNIHFDFDAFIPGSDANNGFGPTIDFLPDEFQFEILDRAGRVVYKSEDPLSCRWDGKIINESLAPEGAYLYVVKYRNTEGKFHFLRGGLAVVYP